MNEPLKISSNTSRTITASEINRFIYCKYQWYYERYYGKQYIRKLYKERNASLGLTDSSLSNFAKGNNFHNNYLSQWRRRRGLLLKTLFAVLILVAVLAAAYFIMYRI